MGREQFSKPVYQEKRTSEASISLIPTNDFSMNPHNVHGFGRESEWIVELKLRRLRGQSVENAISDFD